MRKNLILTSLAFILAILILPVHSHAQSADSIIASAKKHLGVRYVFGGTTPSGFDCSGFLRYVFNENGIQLPRTASEQYNVGTPVAKSALQKGDLVFFETYKRGPSHSGIYLGDGTFISATSSKGVAIVSLNDPYYWGPRYIGAKRVLKDEPVQMILAQLAPGKYHDVSNNHWAYEEIKQLGENNIVNGVGQSLFLPNKTLTRAEAATIINRVKQLPASSATYSYPDIANHWAIDSINAAIEAGYFTGFEDGTFRPNDQLTREQVAALFNRVFALEEKEAVVTFIDVDENHWSYSHIKTFIANNITVGFGDNTYRPTEGVTRAQFVVFLHRVLNQ